MADSGKFGDHIATPIPDPQLSDKGLKHEKRAE
jgi:hypothetical protein